MRYQIVSDWNSEYHDDVKACKLCQCDMSVVVGDINFPFKLRVNMNILLPISYFSAGAFELFPFIQTESLPITLITECLVEASRDWKTRLTSSSACVCVCVCVMCMCACVRTVHGVACDHVSLQYWQSTFRFYRNFLPKCIVGFVVKVFKTVKAFQEISVRVNSYFGVHTWLVWAWHKLSSSVLFPCSCWCNFHVSYVPAHSRTRMSSLEVKL